MGEGGKFPRSRGTQWERGGVREILTPENYYARIKKITAKDVSRVAKEMFVNNKLNLAVIGPYREEGEFERMLKL